MKSDKSKMKIGLILEYERVYGEEPPRDRLSLLCGIHKFEAISLLAYMNYKLSPKDRLYFDYSVETQADILKYILRLEEESPLQDFLNNEITNSTTIFNRGANLYSMIEIMNSDLFEGTDDGLVTSEQLNGFLKYYLAVNSQITQVQKEDDEIGIEFFSVVTIPLNEYFEHVDPINTLYRGVRLFEFIGLSEFGSQFQNYILKISGFSLANYIKEIGGIYLSNHTENDEFSCYFELDEPIKLFEAFSSRKYPIEERYEMEFMDIRKYPLFKIDDLKYLVLDNRLLLEKCFNSLIWSFLFDDLVSGISGRERERIIEQFKGVIGKFFEDYVEELFLESFHFFKHPKPKLFDDLLDSVSNEEYCDIYLRQNKKILFGEQKSSSIPSQSKYGENLTEFYGKDRGEFFDRHGMNQLELNLKRFLDSPKIIDTKVESFKRYRVYPIIITNETGLITGVFPQVLSDEFDTRMSREKYPHVEIKKLSIVHIKDIEFLSGYLKDKSHSIFDFLDKHHKCFDVLSGLSKSYCTWRPKHNSIKLIGKLGSYMNLE